MSLHCPQKVGIKIQRPLEKGWRLGMGSVNTFAAIGVYLVVNLACVIFQRQRAAPLGYRKQGKDLNSLEERRLNVGSLGELSLKDVI